MARAAVFSHGWRMNESAISTDAGLPLDAPGRRRLPMLLRRAWYGMNQAFRRRIAHLGLTPDQFTVLRNLMEGDPRGIPQRELTDHMTSDPNTVASLLERMAAAGLLEKRRHETDRRAYRIRMLPAGRKQYLLARRFALALQTELLETLGEDERDGFLAQLDRIASACRDAAEASPRERSSHPQPSRKRTRLAPDPGAVNTMEG